jgi:hypothetical protein
MGSAVEPGIPMMTRRSLMNGSKDRAVVRSRRAVLKLAGCAAALLGFSATGAQAKSSQASAAYRNSPKGRQSCANCMYFEAPSGCGVVRGPVSARGWCNLWG